MMQRNVKAVVLALGLALASATAGAKTVLPGSLLEVDQNRGAIVESIVEKWGPVLEKSGAGIDKAALRTMVRGLRADRLMAASLAGSPEGLRDVIALSLTSSAPVSSAAIQAGQVKASVDGPDALGNANADLVYTPVTPCRLFDTRASQGGMGTPGLNVRRTYGAIVPVVNQGGPGGCAAPSGATVALMVIGTLTPSGAGLLQGGPQGVANFPNALILYQSGDQYGATIAMPLNPANGQFDLVEQSATADLYGDLLGYFRAPQGGYVSSISAGNGITITGSATAPTVSVSTSISGAVALDCINRVATNAAVPPGNFNIFPPACSAGYTATGGGCRTLLFNQATWGIPAALWEDTDNSTAVNLSCSGTNITAGNITVNAMVRCCRVPAR